MFYSSMDMEGHGGRIHGPGCPGWRSDPSSADRPLPTPHPRLCPSNICDVILRTGRVCVTDWHCAEGRGGGRGGEGRSVRVRVASLLPAGGEVRLGDLVRVEILGNTREGSQSEREKKIEK